MSLFLFPFHFDPRDRLREIGAPTLVVAGRHDSIAAVSRAGKLASGLPHARLVVCVQSGHYPFIEETECFLATARAWLEGEVPGTGPRFGNK